MEDRVDLPPRRVAYRLRAVRLEVQPFARRRKCEACGEQRACAPLNLLAPEIVQQWFCLTSCWAYQLGVKHGEEGAARRITAMVEGAFV